MKAIGCFWSRIVVCEEVRLCYGLFSRVPVDQAMERIETSRARQWIDWILVTGQSGNALPCSASPFGAFEIIYFPRNGGGMEVFPGLSAW